jgi:hydroxyquinol 1,2-dioxygenase
MRDIDEITITIEVLRRLSDTPDPRLREILQALVRHLHQFARDTGITEEEWLQGIRYLTETGQTCDGVRQEFVLLSDTLGLSQLVVSQNHRRREQVTEQTILGPFFIQGLPVTTGQGMDISGGTHGEPLFITARVMASDGPVAAATVDVWQADADGLYDVQRSGWSIDRSQLRATLITDVDGRFSCRSILPKSYPIPMDGPVGKMMRATRRSPMRPAHIHFAIQKAGFDPLVTHVFVEGDEFLESDAVFGVRGSCIGSYERHAPGVAPDGTTVGVPFFVLDHVFRLEPAEEARQCTS